MPPAPLLPPYLEGEIVSNHDELMCNFFAQADALAVGIRARLLSLVNHDNMTREGKSATKLLGLAGTSELADSTQYFSSAIQKSIQVFASPCNLQ